ncbi:hypothetical protein KCU81_g4297, partial [Aureobasidium melanogenum]
MFILMDKNSVVYGKIKRYCECKLGIPSRCVQYAHAQKAQPQYISNVIKGILENSTVVIGADVFYSTPGLRGPSMAAMTVSMNVQGTRYATAVGTNGYRVEMITNENIKKHITSLARNGWMNKVGQGKPPATIMTYFHDDDFACYVDQEVIAMKKALGECNNSPRSLR